MKSHLFEFRITIFAVSLILVNCAGKEITVGGESTVYDQKGSHLVPQAGASGEKWVAWNHSGPWSEPESVYYHAPTKIFYVSNVGGEAGKKDKKGWISKVSYDGKILSDKWVKGLNAPKGIRIFENSLWVSDIDEVVEIDIISGKILRKIKAKKAKFLNDVAIDSVGNIYVSDTVASSIYKVDGKTKKISTLEEGPELEGPNGLLVIGDLLYVAAWGIAEADFSTKVPGRLYSYNLKSKLKRLVTELPLGNLDGLEALDSERFLVTDWVKGKLWIVNLDGSAKELLHGMKGAADIGYDPEKKLLVIPRMGENLITAINLGDLI